MNNGSINGREYYCPRSPGIMRLIDKWENPMLGKVNVTEAKKIVAEAIKSGAITPPKKYFAQQKPVVFAQCPYCKKKFEKMQRRKFCSLSCTSKFQWEERKDNGMELNCVECGSPFKRIRAEKTCSPECSRERQKKTEKNRRERK